MEHDDGEMVVAMQVTHKMRWQSWHGPILREDDLKVFGQLIGPFLERGVVSDEGLIQAPILLSFQLDGDVRD